jgi:hypothetical protein
MRAAFGGTEKAKSDKDGGKCEIQEKPLGTTAQGQLSHQ